MTNDRRENVDEGKEETEKEKKAKDLRANAAMTEHQTDLDELVKTMQTDLATVSFRTHMWDKRAERRRLFSRTGSLVDDSARAPREVRQERAHTAAHDAVVCQVHR